MKRGFLLSPQENVPPKPSEGATKGNNSEAMKSYGLRVLHCYDDVHAMIKQLANIEIRLEELHDIIDSTKGSQNEYDLYKWFMAHTEARWLDQQFNKIETEKNKLVPFALERARKLIEEEEMLEDQSKEKQANEPTK